MICIRIPCTDGKKQYETKPGEQGVKSGENRPVVGYLGTNLEFGTWVDE